MFASRRASRAAVSSLDTFSNIRGLSHVSFKENLRKLSDGISLLTHNAFQQVPFGKDSPEGVYGRVKGSILELMAKNMSATDQEYLLLQWGQSKSDEAPQHPPACTEHTSPCVVSTANAVPNLVVSAKEKEDCTQEQESVITPDVHPVFGQLLADVGYKKVYLTSARKLVLAQVWQKQRTLRPERSAGIAEAKLHSETGFPGVITLFNDHETGAVGIVDGQHRVGALLLLVKKDSWPADEHNILIEVYSFLTSTMPAVENLFTEINSAEPVKGMDMPSEGGDAETKLAIDEGVRDLVKNHPDMFKPSARCRAPHLHADTLREDLYSTEYLLRKDLRSADDLILHLKKLNDQLSRQELQYWGYTADKGGASSQTAKFNAINKATKFHFYLGLSKRWLHE